MHRTLLALLAVAFAASCTPPASAQGWGGPNTWAFEPARDDFRANALLDLRSLNEKVAGESGYVGVDSNGDFLLGNGKPVRFWCVNTGTGRESPFVARPLGRKDAPDLARHARFLAKRGVNMIRLHLQISPDPAKQAFSDINQADRDYTWRAVAAMKKEGIYTTLSLYWGVPMKFSPGWGFLGGADQSALGLLFFDPTLQQNYKAWLRKVLEPNNPYTGIPLAKDPSLAIFQIQNEDSLLFWTVNNIKGPQRERLEKLFGDFLTRKYGNAAGIARAWQNDRTDADRPNLGRYELLNIWEMTQVRQGGRQARLSDQTEFYSRTMHDFNKEIVRFLRQDLGMKHLVNAGNWKTADNVRLNDAERWSYTAAEVDAVNRYFGGIHKGPNEGWAIVNGDKFTSKSALLEPADLPINLRQTVGRPILVTESSWVFPNGYAAEGPFLISVFSSLNGVDGYFWFATGDDEWTPPQSANGYLPSQAKWLFGNPDMLGTFPAAALLYRMGYVKRGAPVLSEQRNLTDLWERRVPLLAEDAGFDPNRDMGSVAPRSPIRSQLNPLAYLVGPVHVKFDADPAGTSAMPLGAFITPEGPRSNTGEVVLNSVQGWCTVDAPKAQGVAAFFTRRPVHRLSTVTFSSRNAFGSVLAVSMDDKPLANSGKILVQYATESRPANWVEAPATIDLDGRQVPGLEVKSFGQAPWQVQRAKLDVIVKNPALRKATVLDMNGNALRTLAVTRDTAGFRFAFPENAMYVVLE